MPYTDTLVSDFKNLLTASDQKLKLTNYSPTDDNAIAPGALELSSQLEVEPQIANDSGANRVSIQAFGLLSDSVSESEVPDNSFNVTLYGRSSGGGLIPLLEVKFTLGTAKVGSVDDKIWYACNKVEIIKKYCSRLIEINGQTETGEVMAGARVDISFDLQGVQQIYPEFQLNDNTADAKLLRRLW